jgi:hypothetical protein
MSDDGKLDLVDRIELRRFVGRELCLWLWFESEIFEATLSTKKHGTFGLWLEGRLVLSEGREVTTIKGTMPGHHREAKESLLRGKSPEAVGLHLTFGDHDVRFSLKGEALAIAGLVSPPAREPKEEKPILAEGAPRRKKKAEEPAADAAHEAFYERMHLAHEVEGVIEALYKDFLTLRLSDAYATDVLPAVEAWVGGEEVDVEGYERMRKRVLGTPAADVRVERRRRSDDEAAAQ